MSARSKSKEREAGNQERRFSSPLPLLPRTRTPRTLPRIRLPLRIPLLLPLFAADSSVERSKLRHNRECPRSSSEFVKTSGSNCANYFHTLEEILFRAIDVSSKRLYKSNVFTHDVFLSTIYSDALL